MQLDRNKKIIVAVLLLVIIIIPAWYFYGWSIFQGEIARIDIGSCSEVSPSFLSVKEGEPVYIFNRSFKSHTVGIAESEVRLGARKGETLTVEFIYGSGTYVYSCDGVENVGQIQIVAIEQNLLGTELTFKEMYDSFGAKAQSCVKKTIGKDFDKVYAGEEGIVLGKEYQDGINKCLEAQANISEEAQQ